MEAISIGDLHLTNERGTGGLAKYMRDYDAYACSEVSRACAWARKRHIQHVFMPGDICDGTRDNSRLSYEAHLALLRLFAENSDMTFYIIPGNHDLVSKDPSEGHSLQLLMAMTPPNVVIMDKPTIKKIDGHKVAFFPYPYQDWRKDMLNVGHVEVRGAKSDSGRPFDSEELSKSKAVIVMNHLHTMQRVRNTFYSGTLYQTNFGEGLEKYFAHIQWDGPEDYEITMVPFKPKIELHTCVISSRRDMKDVPKGEHQLVKLVLLDGCDVSAKDYQHLTNIAVVKPFKTKEELAMVLTEDLAEGVDLVIRTDDFFKEWLTAVDVSPDLRKQITRVRKRVLEGVK